MFVYIRSEGRVRSPRLLTLLRTRARRMLTSLSLKDAELSILVCDDAIIHRLNRDYRRKDKPTDVLAFALREGEESEHAGAMLGDVVISVPTARRQAKERRVSLEEECTMLLAHGLLHLLGYDHRTAREDRVMRALTDRLVASATAARALVDKPPTTPPVKGWPARSSPRRNTK